MATQRWKEMIDLPLVQEALRLGWSLEEGSRRKQRHFSLEKRGRSRIEVDWFSGWMFTMGNTTTNESRAMELLKEEAA